MDAQPITELHGNIAEKIGKKPALVLSYQAFEGFLLKHLRKSAQAMMNGPGLPIESLPSISASLDSLPQPLGVLITQTSTGVHATLKGGFTLKLALHVTGKKALRFSTIEIEVGDVTFSLGASAPMIHLNSPTFVAKGKVDVAKTRDEAIAAVDGLSKGDVERVEGALAFLMPSRVVQSALASARDLDIASAFPAFDLHGDWELKVVLNALLIVPALGIELRESTGCPVLDSVPELTVKAEDSETSADGISVKLKPYLGTQFEYEKPSFTADAFAGVYGPISGEKGQKSVWQKRFEKTMPAVVHRENDHGFIGWDVNLTAAVKYIGVKIDVERYGFVVDMEIMVWGRAFLDIDVPCVGRQRLAETEFDIAESSVAVRVSGVARDSKLSLVATVDSLKIGDAKVKLSFLSQYGGMVGGPAGVIGIAADYFLRRILERDLPEKLRKTIRENVSDKNVDLIDLGSWKSFAKYAYFAPATFSGDADSVLMGLTSIG